MGTALCASLSGCINVVISTKNEEKTESSIDPADKVADYVRDELKIDGAKIDPESKEVKGEDGFTDTLWSVYDEKSDVTFYVSDDSYWPGEMLESSLTDDYDDSIFEKFMSSIKLDDLTYEIDCKGLIYDYDEAELKSGYEEKYLLCALDYRFDDAIADFTDQEIKEIVSDSNNVERLGIVKDGEKTAMYAYKYNHFTANEIKEITGLEVVVGE